MSQEIVIDLKPDGSVEGMHFDALPLMSIFKGEVKVERASSITFNTETNSWDVTLAGMKAPLPLAQGFDGYNRAIAFEVAWLQGARKQGVAPTSVQGLVLGIKARRVVDALDKVPERA